MSGLLTLLVWQLLLQTQAQAACQPSFHPTAAQKSEERVQQARKNRSEQLRRLFQEACLDYPPRRVLLRALKLEARLELWVEGAEGKYVKLKDYEICMSSGRLGPKRRLGDLQVPEGFYRVTWHNPRSNFWLSLKINYPNPSDLARGDRKHPGGDIFIHGSCVTIGCIPITDEGIEELYLIALDSHFRYGRPALVQIFPARLDEVGMQKLESDFAGQKELLDFWRELQPGYLALEKLGRPREPQIDKAGRYYFPP